MATATVSAGERVERAAEARGDRHVERAGLRRERGERAHRVPAGGGGGERGGADCRDHTGSERDAADRVQRGPACRSRS